MGAIRPGYFRAEDMNNVEALAPEGGVIYRTAFTAAVLNSTHINARLDSPNVWEDVNFGFNGVAAMANKPAPFQYVQQASYAGLIPWQILPEIPQRNPWE